jgi:hypothetical protein
MTLNALVLKTVEKSIPSILGYFCNLKRPKENCHPIVKKSPNLETLPPHHPSAIGHLPKVAPLHF